MTQHTRVLAYVNRIRKELGKKPIKRLPKGERRSPVSCPIARGIGSGARFSGVAITPNGHYDAPQYVRNFVYLFDSGQYPELVRK